MRVFGRSRNTKTPTYRRTSVASAAGTASTASERAEAAVEAVEPVELARTEELPIVRETLPSMEAAREATSVAGDPARPSDERSDLDAELARPGDAEVAESDVFVSRRSPPDMLSDADADARAAVEACVTLFVYGWENVEPGPLSWAFPSLRAALVAVRAMRNAVEWCIVAGAEWVSVDAARAEGAVLVEQNA